MQRNIAKTSDYDKVTYVVIFLLFCSYRFGELRVRALLCYSLVFPDLGTFLLPAPNTKEKPSGNSRVEMESCCHSPAVEESGFCKWETVLSSKYAL